MQSTSFRFIDLADKLPPCIARKEIGTFLGGAISSRTLANADSAGLGPVRTVRVGRNVVYETLSLLEWLDTTRATLQ